MVKKILKYSFISLVLLFLYAPIILLTIYSFNGSTTIGIWSKEWTFDLYVDLYHDKDLLQTVANTLILALVSAVISTVLGTMGAIGMFYSKKKTYKTLSGITNIPVINAEIVTAISIALICSLLAFGRTYASLLIGHVVLTFPFVVLNVLPKLKQMNPNVYEASLDLGASPVKALFSVIIPQIMSGIFSGFLMAITLSLDDYIITTFTKPSTFDTISTYVYDAYAKGGRSSSVPALRALSAIIFLVMITVIIVANVRASKRREK